MAEIRQRKRKVIDVFTQEELILLSNSILTSIQCIGEIKQKTFNVAAINAFDEEMKQLVELNNKVCGMMKE